MAKNQSTKTRKVHHPSELERFQLSFEYDKTLQEIRRDVRQRSL